MKDRKPLEHVRDHMRDDYLISSFSMKLEERIKVYGDKEKILLSLQHELALAKMLPSVAAGGKRLTLEMSSQKLQQCIIAEIVYIKETM